MGYLRPNKNIEIMAKCLKKDGEVVRMLEGSEKKNEDILKRVSTGWNYCSKSEWKKNRPQEDEEAPRKKVRNREE